MTYKSDEEVKKEFDERFGEYGSYSVKGLDALQTEVEFRLSIKDFILSLRSADRQALREEVEEMKLHYPEYGENEGDYIAGQSHFKSDVLALLDKK